HAPDASSFFREVSRVLRPRGRLLLCDDFLTHRSKNDDPLLDHVRRSWHANSLLGPEAVAELASVHGLTVIGDRHLTPYLRLSSELVLSALSATGDVLSCLPWIGKSGFVDNWIGGTALQQCQHRGWMDYRFLSFEKR